MKHTIFPFGHAPGTTMLSSANLDITPVVEPGVIEVMVGSTSEDMRRRGTFAIIRTDQ